VWAVSTEKNAGSHPESATPAGTGPDRPTTTDDTEELQQEIERTREHLGDTVQQLAAKADVKAVARDKATKLSERMKGKTGRARIQATTRAAGIRSQLAGKTTAARHRAQSVSEGRMAQVREQVAAVGTPVWDATPKQVRDVVAMGAAGARQRRVPLAVAAGALVLGLLLIRRRRGRR
jgi:Protein of unknown function (DUF3618)